MSQFLKVKTANEVLRIIALIQPLGVECIKLGQAFGRILADPIVAPEPVPHFPRSTMDGYAVRARDTFGASEILPTPLEVGGEVSIGQEAPMGLNPGHAIAIPTGGMLPEGADSVVMVEYTQVLDERTIEVTRPVAPGDNVLEIGEDIRKDEKLFPAGWCLRPQDIGVLAALGITAPAVYRRPRVAVLSTGDEIVPASTPTLPAAKIRDMNSFTLTGQIREAGGLIGSAEIVRDDLDALIAATRMALIDHDVLVLSGGSSVGARDFTMRILSEFSEAELLVHGIAIRPGKPTMLARIGEKIFWGLPGQPVSAMMICRAFVQPSLRFLEGMRDASLSGKIEDSRSAILSRQLPSVHGRTDYVPVTLSVEDGLRQATPVFGKSAMISALVKSDGYVVIPEHVEGLDRGTEVTVHLFRTGVDQNT